MDRKKDGSRHLPDLTFFHLPKTAGTSIGKFLRLVYGRHNVWNPLVAKDRKLPEAKVRLGHFMWESFEEHRRPGDVSLVFLREPRERLLSWIYFLRSLKPDLEDPAFRRQAELYHQPMQEILSNALDPKHWTEYLLSEPYLRALTGAAAYADLELRDPEAMVARVKERLLTFDVVGLVERMPESRQILVARLGIDDPAAEIPRVNTFEGNLTTPRRQIIQRQAIDDATEALIQRLIRYDNEVYVFAKGLFLSRP